MHFKYAIDHLETAGDLGPEDIRIIEALTPKDVVALMEGEKNVKVLDCYLNPYLRGYKRYPTEDEIWFYICDRPIDHFLEDDPTPYDNFDDEVIRYNCVHLYDIQI